MNIKEKEVGKEYLEVLKDIIEIRITRRKLYLDSFLTDNPNTLLTFAKGKIKRFEFSKKKDDLRDSINYLIFLLCILK